MIPPPTEIEACRAVTERDQGRYCFRVARFHEHSPHVCSLGRSNQAKFRSSNAERLLSKRANSLSGIRFWLPTEPHGILSQSGQRLSRRWRRSDARILPQEGDRRRLHALVRWCRSSRFAGVPVPEVLLRSHQVFRSHSVTSTVGWNRTMLACGARPKVDSRLIREHPRAESKNSTRVALSWAFANTKSLPRPKRAHAPARYARARRRKKASSESPVPAPACRGIAETVGRCSFRCSRTARPDHCLPPCRGRCTLRGVPG
jgi:hypothetical protein